MLPSRVREDMWLQGQTHVKQRAEETQPERKRIHVPYTEHVRHTEVPRWVFEPQKVDDYSGGKTLPRGLNVKKGTTRWGGLGTGSGSTPCRPLPEGPSERGARGSPGGRSARLSLQEGHLEQLAGRGCSLPLGVDLLAAIAFHLHALGPLYVEGDFLGKRRQNQDPCLSRLQSRCESHGESTAKS